MSNYPPGVTGNEPAFGADYENERLLMFDFICTECETVLVKGTTVTVQAHADIGMWVVCPFCDEEIHVDADTWEAIDRAPRRGRTVVHTRSTDAAEPESTQAFMQRTDPVGYQHCRDAGRF